MLLKSLELQGFKTFPDKTLLSFEEGITAVVGPNGSGKSNISDAMRWVLGEQSTRALRCTKMEDVIFSGTPGRKAQGFAEVTLTIDNTDRQLNFDGDTVAITRRFYRSGESEYRINKTMVRLKDVHELFMDTGLGRDGYSIIGQGKIDSIVSAKSEDRREIFEEAAGISRYRYRKEEAERRLERAEENLVRLRDILQELEGRIEPLRIQSEKAEKFIALDSDKKNLEIGIWMETLGKSGKSIREAEEKITAASVSYNEAEEKLKAVAESIEKNYSDTNSCTVLMEEAKSAASQADENAARIDGEISVAENDIHHINERIGNLNADIEDASKSEQEIADEIEAKEAAVREKDVQIAENNAALIAVSRELEELRSGMDNTAAELTAAAAELAENNAELYEQRLRKAEAESSVQEIRLRSESIDGAIADCETLIKSLALELSEINRMISDTQNQTEEAENRLHGHEIKLSAKRKQTESAKADADKLRLDAGEQLRNAKLLEDLERNLEGFTKSVKTVMRASGNGVLNGIHGPVTRLLRVPPQYATALETALGMAMQNIVVENDDAAKSAIRFLKQRDAGRATFLPLSTMRGSVIDARSVSGMSGFIGVASELCDCAPQYVNVKNDLLGRTIVAETLDDAAEIARKMNHRYRIVSLDGQLVNAGGSFTGGSASRNSGLLSRAGEIERIKKRARELTVAAEKAEAVLKRAQEETALEQAQLDVIRGELDTLRGDMIRFDSEKLRIERDIAAQEKQTESLFAEKNGASERLDELNGVIARADESILKIDRSTEVIRLKMSEMEQSRDEKTRQCDEMVHKLQELRIAGLTVQKDRESLSDAIEALVTRKTDRTERLRTLSEQIAVSNEEIERHKLHIEQLKADKQKMHELSSEKRAFVEAKALQRAELEKQAVKLRTDERDTNSVREAMGQELVRLRERLDTLNNEQESILAKLWEEYELTRREAEEFAFKIDDIASAQRRLADIKNKIRALGAVNVGAVVEYKEVSERYTFMKEQTEDVEKSKAELLRLIDDLTKNMQSQFTERFSDINRCFSQIFKDLFGGGEAVLEFSDPADILNSGIEIRVHPPGKIVSHIELLSGGEKALVAIAIYFAIMRVSPPPFCMLDEIEAALDEVNVVRFANYLRRMNERTQFITITHRRGTMEEADMLYGVTMQDQGISRLLSIKTHEEIEKLGS